MAQAVPQIINGCVCPQHSINKVTDFQLVFCEAGVYAMELNSTITCVCAFLCRNLKMDFAGVLFGVAYFLYLFSSGT